jgi:hypothetical protein
MVMMYGLLFIGVVAFVVVMEWIIKKDHGNL